MANDRPGAAARIIRWIDYRLPFVQFLNHELNEYPTPRNLSYWWNYGSLAGIMLVVMIVTGIFLAMQYTPSADLAFDSVERIMRDVNFGWLLRYAHMNGASMFFAIVYIHLFRGLYYGSYKAPRELLWILGVIILVLLIATAFMGYVLPWGQMSYWAATVITNLFSAIPLIGPSIVTFLWGGFAVGDPTLHRFYALHYLLPFVIVAIVLLHLVALHRHGSNNPLGIDHKGPQDTIPFHPYYTVKDLFGLSVFLIIFAFFVFFAPKFFGESRIITFPQTLCRRQSHCPGMVSSSLLRHSAVDYISHFVHFEQTCRSDFGVRVDIHIVLAAVAGHLAGSQRPLSTDLQMGVLASGHRRRGTRLGRGQPTGRDRGDCRPDRDILLLRAHALICFR